MWKEFSVSFLFFQWKWKSCILGVYGWIFGHDVPGCRPRLNFGHTLSRFTYLMHISVCIFKLSVICHCTAFVSCFSNKPNGTRLAQLTCFFYNTTADIVCFTDQNYYRLKQLCQNQTWRKGRSWYFLECADSTAVKEDFNSGLELEAVNYKKGVRLFVSR